ncbi:MAG: four helix bundle protein [Prevotella sp.]|nr:four helix bundle protein [Prevotella sp.]
MAQAIENNIYEIASDFAIRIVKLYKYLTESKNEHVMSKQLLRAGTSIGANAFEGKNAYSRDDFAFKMSIALKEAGEAGFWIDLLHRSQYLDDTQYESLFQDWNRLYAVLTKIVKSTKPQIFKHQTSD